MFFLCFFCVFIHLTILPPKARRRSRLTTNWPDSKSLYLEIDASSGANSTESSDRGAVRFEIAISPRTESSDHEIIPFEIAVSRDRRILRRWFLQNWKAETLSFSECYFLLNFDLRKASKQRFRIDTLKLVISNRTVSRSDASGVAPSAKFQNSLRNYRKIGPAQTFGFFWGFLWFFWFFVVYLGFLRFEFS